MEVMIEGKEENLHIISFAGVSSQYIRVKCFYAAEGNPHNNTKSPHLLRRG
jgi:hypothetical protein